MANCRHQQQLALSENASCEAISKFAFTSSLMYFSRKSTSASSSSMQTSPSASTKRNGRSTGGNSVNNRGQSGMQKKLTRQRKLRYASDQELGLQFVERLNSPPASPESAKKSLFAGGSDHWPSSALPQPLPLPETPLTRRRQHSDFNLGPTHSGPPEEWSDSASRKKITDQIGKLPNYRKRFSHDANLENTNYDLRLNITTRSAPSSGFSSPAVSPRRSNARDVLPSFIVMDSAKPSNHYHGDLSHDLLAEGVDYNLGRIASTWSAPTSGFPSPVVSPQRSNTIDFLPSHESPQEFQACSDFEIPDLGRLSTRVHDQSPPHNPTLQSPHLKPKSDNKFSFPLHHTMPPGSPKEWSESNGHASAHPLPLPPGATPTLSSAAAAAVIDHNTTENANASSRKSQWQKGKLIGRGTYGCVYIGTNLETGASCAIKEVDIIPDDPKSAECIKQLEQEIRVLSHLKHDNIVQYYGSEIIDDHFFIYLEYIHPGSLSKYIHEHCEVMTESIVRSFTRHILSGLAYLHSKKTVHRDIKGANLLVNSSGVVKLADFGMAKHLTGLSCQLSLKGSPHWMAPEVLKATMMKDAKPDLAFAVDIWSLGCTIIEMFTRKPPWGEVEGARAMFKVLNGSPPIPETLSPEGKDFLSHCFQRNPAERPSAFKLLDHPFVRNSNNLASRQILIPKTRSEPTSPAKSFKNGKLPSRSDTAHHSCGAASHHPGYYTAELPPYLSTTLLVQGSHNFSSSPNVHTNVLLGAANNHPLAHSRSPGKEVPHI